MKNKMFTQLLEIITSPVVDNEQTGSSQLSGYELSEGAKWFSSNWYYIVIGILVLTLIITIIYFTIKINKRK